MSGPPVIDFLAGAVTFAYAIAGVFFLRFWRVTRDGLFLSFALAFWLFALNQLLASFLDAGNENTGLVYVLRILGSLLIAAAIVRKNLRRGGGTT